MSPKSLSKDLTIKPAIQILGQNKKEVGNNLESLAIEMFGRAGFGSFIRNAFITGTEIDLQARHRITGIPMLCECKAHNVPMDTTAVRLFYAVWEKERQTKPRLAGIFISTSGFTGTVKQWYEELNTDTQEAFKLIDADEFLSQLIATQLTLPPEAISDGLDRRFSIGKLQNYWLTFSIHGLAWFYVFSLDGKPAFFSIVDGDGNAIPTWKCHEILSMSRKRELSSLRLFGIDLRQKVQLELLKVDSATISHLAEEIHESDLDVSLALDILTEQGVVEQSNPGKNYRFVRDVVAFITIAKAFITSSDGIAFLSSRYAQEMIYSTDFISFIDARFRLDMSPRQKETATRIIAISPSALHHAITQETSRHITTREDIERIFCTPETLKEKAKWLEHHQVSLLEDLMIHAISDLVGAKYSLSDHLSNLGIQQYLVKAKFVATGHNWKTLSVDTNAVHFIRKFTGKVAAGNLISTSNPAAAAMNRGMLYLEAHEYNEAKKFLQEALDICESTEVSAQQRQTILCNYAVVFMREGSWGQALEFLLKALDLGTPEFVELFLNILHCYVELNNIESSIRIMAEAQTIFPEVINSEIYKIAKDKLLEIELT